MGGQEIPDRPRFAEGKLFLASVATLYLEVLLIRYVATEIRLFAYLQNLVLIASFLGIGLGMMESRFSRAAERYFPGVFSALLLALILAGVFHLPDVPIPSAEYHVFGSDSYHGFSPHIQAAAFLVVSGSVLALVVAFFLPLGRWVGDGLEAVRGLRSYGINLAGSLVGLCLFTVLSFYSLGPFVWLLVGLAMLAPFLWRKKPALAGMGMVVLLAYPAAPNLMWSPYYRIDLRRGDTLPGRAQPHVYFLNVNHQYHQKMLDLSREFLLEHPEAEPNRSAVLTYELPYRLVKATPGNVLIVGAGTGNDVAAALRYGVPQIDAVEIDPVIYALGRKYHPERPYDSRQTTVYIDDARAFFKKTRRKYDLIVFAYLDAHTLLSSFSSVRLDNYVYTLESLQEARSLLAPAGTLTVAFASGTRFVDQRLYASLKQAFDGVAPHAYRTGYDGEGMLYVQGAARSEPPLAGVDEVGASLAASDIILPTDRWPFLYLASRTIPLAMLVVLVALLIAARRLLRASGLSNTVLRDPSCRQFLLLGAGFLLLETKGVTEASLLFGSTWLTNAVVIAGFLLMAMLANLVVALRPIRLRVAYAGLFLALAINFVVPYSALTWLAFLPKIVLTALLVGLPVFFSGLAFSELYRRAPDPTTALGANLLGAVLGGTLENLVMIGGTPLLGVLAILLYGSAAWTTFSAQQQEQRATLARAAEPAQP